MPTLPEEEVRPEHQEATQSAKPNVLAAGTGMNTTPAIVLPEVTGSSDKESDRATHLRCPSPIQRKSSRNSRASLSSASSLTTVDGDGHVYDLVNDQLPDVELSDEDRKKNTELLEEAKKISERFHSRRSRRSRTSVSDSPPEPDMAAVRTMAVPSLQAGEEEAPSPIRDKEMKLLEVPGSRQHDAQVKSEQHTRKLSPARTTSETRKQSPAKKAIENRNPSPGAVGFQLSSRKVMDASVHRKEAVSLEAGAGSESKPLDKNRHSPHVKGAESATKSSSLERNMIPMRPPQALGSETGAVRTSIEHAAPRPRVPCTAEIKSLSSQPLLRAVSWECLEVDGELNAPPSPPLQTVESFDFSVLDTSQLRAFDCKELPVEPKLQKLTKLREENKLMRSQNLSAQRLPDLSESNEQERGPSPVPCPATNGTDGSCDATPSIPDCLLRKLKVQRTLPAGLPPLTEKEVENTFVQLSLAFKNDSYTLEARLGLAERERNLAEDNTERELENFKSELKSSASLWANSEQREAQERLLETVAVLQRLAIRLSGRAEMVGAVRQEKRMSKATEVMMQYVENLKRMYEKDHAELTEFKKLANQNSNRNYSPYGDSSDDGVPRTARSMSLTLGKSVPRRRVSVAVLPKFVNFPGQPGSASAVPTVAAVVGHPLICKTDMESNNNTEANTASSTSNSSSSETITSTTSAVPSSSSRTSPMLAPVMEMKQNDDKEVAQTAAGTVRPLSLDLTSLETKAKIEEEAFNKGYQEGLKAQLSQDQKELRHETGKAEGASEGPPADTSLTEGKKASKLEEVTELIVRLCPKPARHRSVIWVVATFVLLLAVLSSIFASLRSPCDQATGSPSTKGSCLSSGHSSTWPFWRLWHRNRAQA
ncbi:inositol 1,4,5-triphosphate receptor associated 1 isoform X1 [Mobula hypostoma]|uniref:inositol 1,4,5-triphosphate receptor associated 1 isoform X1 n=1 Tax=Mobula hypostoma TaxID=723540 RepID=UPI002FC366BA